MMKFFGALMILVIGILLTGCLSTTPAPGVTPVPGVTPAGTSGATPTSAELKSIIDTLSADGRFTTFVTVLQAAELNGTLRDDGPYTVFAPDDDAFNKLPNGTVETLLNTPQGQLSQILTYHIADGKIMAVDLVNLTSVTSLQGSDLNVSVTSGKIYINGAELLRTDIEAQNGVIHVISTVQIPPENPDLTPTINP